MTIKKSLLLSTFSVLSSLSLIACTTGINNTSKAVNTASQSLLQNKIAAPDFFIVSNKAEANTIYQFSSKNGEQYAMVGEYNTGGTGTGDLEIPALKKDDTHPLANGDDPLISAYAISASQDSKNIVVVNPGNATISLMKRGATNAISAVNTAPATDLFPISVAIHADYVVVASVGDSNMKGSIGLFKILNGRLVSLADNRRDLQARPSTVKFSSNGRFVIVNELVTGKIKAFSLTDGALSKEPVSVVNSPKADGRFQAIPVGFDLKPSADGGDIIIMSEARFLTPEFSLREGNGSVVQSPLYSWQTGSLSTYKLSQDGSLSLISGDILTGTEIEGGELANCWVVLSPDGKTLWAANALSSSISSFDISDNGVATLKNATAYKDESETLFFGDLNVSADGKTLYQLVGNKGQVAIFDIQSSGDLKLRQTVSGMPELGTYGLLLMP